MESSGVILDSSIFIEFLRKRNKSKTVFFQLIDQHEFYASVLSRFEVEVGLKPREYADYESLLNQITFVPVDYSCIQQAVKVDTQLKPINQRIALADLLIAATALRYQLPVVTLNLNHFRRVPYLKVVALPPP